MIGIQQNLPWYVSEDPEFLYNARVRRLGDDRVGVGDIRVPGIYCLFYQSVLCHHDFASTKEAGGAPSERVRDL
jgi:hypothetical protein